MKKGFKEKSLAEYLEEGADRSDDISLLYDAWLDRYQEVPAAQLAEEVGYELEKMMENGSTQKETMIHMAYLVVNINEDIFI